jgi:hypothetical protein
MSQPVTAASQLRGDHDVDRDRTVMGIVRDSAIGEAAVAEKRRRELEQRNELLAQLNDLRLNGAAELAPLQREAIAAGHEVKVAEAALAKARADDASAMGLLWTRENGLQHRIGFLQCEVTRLADPRIWRTLNWVNDVIARMCAKTTAQEVDHSPGWGMPRTRVWLSNVADVRDALAQAAVLRDTVIGMRDGEQPLDPRPLLEKIRTQMIGLAHELGMDPLPELVLDTLPV